MALSDIVPINRREEFLQAIADKSGAPSPVTRIEEFLKRISESSGGSSLPEYTSADLGKVLTVGEAEPVAAVPEQTVTVEGDPSFVENADASYFVTGQAAVMKINGNSYNVTAAEQHGIIGFVYAAEENVYQFLYFAESVEGFPAGVYFVAETDGEYTVSLEIPSDDVITTWKPVSTDLPAAPSENGIYLLSVNNGVLSWSPEYH